MLKVNFEQNWNKKLDCDIFSTIRMNRPGKEEYYRKNEGNVFEVYVGDKKVCNAELMGIKVQTYSKLIDQDSVLLVIDTGKPYTEAVALINSFYKNIRPDQEFLILVFRRVK